MHNWRHLWNFDSQVSPTLPMGSNRVRRLVCVIKELTALPYRTRKSASCSNIKNSGSLATAIDEVYPQLYRVIPRYEET